jgi:hypothetical protein
VGGAEFPTNTPKPTNSPTPTPTPTDSSGIGGSNLPSTHTPTSARLAQNLTTPTSGPSSSQLMDSGAEDYTIIYFVAGLTSLLLSGALIFSTKE